MTTLGELYHFYCRRTGCKPNSRFARQLEDKQLTSFDFSGNLVGTRGLSPVLEIARNNPALVSIDLSGNMLDKDAVRRVVEMAVHHPSLQRVCLNNNPIHGASFKLLSYMLANNSQIVSLEVEGTDLSDHHRERLAGAAARNCENPQDSHLPRSKYTRITTKGAGGDQGGDGLAVEVASAWTAETAGGCVNYTSWRRNPQFLLYVSRPCTVTITLSQPDGKHHAGLVVARRADTAPNRLLKLPAIDVIKESGFSNETSAKCVVTLDAGVKGKHPPYTIIPMCFYPDRLGKFILRCSPLSNSSEGGDPPAVSLEEVQDSCDWYRHPDIHSAWVRECAGGSRAHASWRSNPQFLLKTGVSGKMTTKVNIFLSKTCDGEKTDERHIGFYLLKGHPGGRRLIFMDPDDFAGECACEQTNEVSLSTELVGGKDHGYVIIPFCSEPGVTGSFTLSVFASGTVNVKELSRSADWKETVLQGAWTSGSDGGQRSGISLKSWFQNPSYSLGISATTEVLILLERHSGPDVDPHNRRPVRHAITVTDDTAAFEEVASSSLTARDAECAVWLRELPKYLTEYIIVPHTEQQGQHGRYTLRIYSSLHVNVSSSRSVEARAQEKAKIRYQEENVAARRQRDLSAPDDFFKPQAASGSGGQEAAGLREAITDRCTRTGVPHIDKEFPPGWTQVWREPDYPEQRKQTNLPIRAWKRPHEGRADPALFKGGTRGGDVVQGMLEDAWVLGPLALVATRPDLIRHLYIAAYPDYGFHQLRIYKCGTWRVVTVDDTLAVDASVDQSSCVFASSPDSDELWVSLAEKAYAKIHGSYQALEGSGNAAHALRDFTGGQIEVLDLLDEASKELYRSGVLWERLRGALRNKWLLGAQLLTSRGTRHDEKRSMGVHPDRLYGILECRDVLGRRLLRIRDPWNLCTWRGRWSDDSKQWTQEMYDALDYKPADDGTFWMAWEDFGYYFNEVLICRMHSDECAVPDHWSQAQLSGSWTKAQSGGHALDGGDRWLENPQYSIEVPGATPGEVLPVWVSVEQPDARLRPIANVDAQGNLNYQVGIGMHVVDSVSNDRRLLGFPTDPGDELWTLKTTHGRETGRELQLKPADRGYILVPFADHPGQTGEYIVSVACPKTIKLKLIEGDQGVSVTGKWTGLSAGGAPGKFGSWRNNPMFLVSPSETVSVTVVLAQKNETESTTAKIGFVVLSANHIRRPLVLDEEAVVARCEHSGQERVTTRVELKGIKERSGLPYVIIPSTYYPGQESEFDLQLVGNKRISIKPIDPELDWERVHIDGSWSQDDGTAGGGLLYPTWRSNAQYALHFSDRSVSLRLVVSKRLPPCADNDSSQIGVVIFKCSAAEGGVRRKVTYTKEEIVGEAHGDAGEAFVEMDLTLPGNLGDGYIIMPHTKYPYTDGAYSIAIYSATHVAVKRVEQQNDWRIVQHPGDWVPGATAGGMREKHRSWISNPHYSLVLRSPATVVVVLSQQPLQVGQVKGHRREPPPKGKGHLERYRPPMIVDTRNNNEIGIDLCQSDEDLTAVANSGYTYHSEITLVRRLKAGAYTVVPHTAQAEIDCDFVIQCFVESHDFTFTKVERQRRFY